ncbi:unnamed protein product [Didymodactylos carnosus]|uniref:Uncharacterized protein n=2 Tax=Didymodactylos carnosus TaxID=1234261 RepID=A0A814YVN5_9BILA|nr:unnamed protein product [Didymodactylos carnosus]CAF3996669.1 unnamed protein product [Didymodactylos carnosus]
MPAITLDPLIHLEDLDIQNMYSLTENELIQLFNESSVSRKKFQYLKKLSLPRYATDNIIALISRSTYSLKLTCLNLSSCSSITNRTVIFITKYMHNLIELNLSYCLNITDFALFGIPIKTNEKLIDWLDEQEIRKQFINDLISLSPTIFKYSEIHDQQVCHCTQINVSSKCAYLTLDYSKKSSFESILSILTNNQLFLKYFHPIKKLKQLKRLYLKQCIQLTDLILFYALEFPTLEILDLSYCELLTDKYLHLIGENNPCLELINIINCRNISEYGEEQLKMNAKRLKLFED